MTLNGHAFQSNATLGLDLGGSNLRWVISTEKAYGEVSKLKAPNSYDESLELLSSIITKAVKDHGISSVGLGLPGRTDPDKPIWIPNLTFLNQSNFGRDLELKTGIPITFINDAQAALIGEVNFGSARGCRNAILVTLGTGIGGAIMIEGEIYVGHNGTAGSFGWLMAPVRLHPNPEHGPWERWAAGSTLTSIAKDLGLSSREFLSQETLNSEGVARQALIDYAHRVGKGLGSLASLLDPQIIIVSGGIVDSWQILTTEISSGFTQTSSPSVRNCPIKVASLGSNAGAIGAAVTARRYFANVRQTTKEKIDGK
jgi:predicted NBD/HSP70 family sugar kinase